MHAVPCKFVVKILAAKKVSWSGVEMEKAHAEHEFYNSAITKPVVCARIVIEIGSHLTKMVPVQSHNSFLDQKSRKVIV